MVEQTDKDAIKAAAQVLQLEIKLREVAGKNSDKPKKALKGLLEDAVDISISNVKNLRAMEVVGRGDNDKRLTLNEFITFTAAQKASAAIDASSSIDPSKANAALEKLEQDIAKFKRDENFIKTATADFTKLENANPDTKPGDGVINITDVAKGEIAFLEKTFPDLKNLIKPTDPKQNMNPIEYLNSIQKTLQQQR